MTTRKLSTKRRRSRKSPIIIGIILLFILGGGTYLAISVFSGSKSDASSEISDSTKEEENLFVSSDTPLEDTKKDTEEDRFNEVPQYEGTDPNSLEELTGNITYSSVNGDNFSIRVSIDQLLGSGTCKINLISGSASYDAEAPIFMSGGNSSSCEGFDIPLSELSASKNWNITINLTSGDKTGTITGSANL